jgi:cytochrome P450
MTQAPLEPVHIRRDRFDPVAELGRLRIEQPVTKITLPWGAPCWLVTRYDDVRVVLGDATRFANGAPPLIGEGQSDSGLAGSGFFVAYDPPAHTMLRRLLTPEFTVARIRRLQPRIEAIVAEHMAAMEQAGPPVDLVEAFALPIPSLVICELLGVPYTDRAKFQRYSRQRLDMSASLESRSAAAMASHAYMAELVGRERANPGQEMIGMLIREHGAQLTDRELTGVADLLLLAGHETTSNMLGLGTLLLLQQPDQLALLRDNDDRVDQAVEELLRYLSVVHSVLPRIAQEDLTLGGQEIKAGELVLCSLPSANRDEGFGADLDRLDLTRKITGHLTFGHGIHHCLGAPLARMEMRIAYPALLRRFPTLRLAVPIEDVSFRAHSIVYGVESLPVTW